MSGRNRLCAVAEAAKVLTGQWEIMNAARSGDSFWSPRSAPDSDTALPMRFDTLPEDILVSILEYGKIGIPDALSLRLVESTIVHEFRGPKLTPDTLTRLANECTKSPTSRHTGLL